MANTLSLHLKLLRSHIQKGRPPRHATHPLRAFDPTHNNLPPPRQAAAWDGTGQRGPLASRIRSGLRPSLGRRRALASSTLRWNRGVRSALLVPAPRRGRPHPHPTGPNAVQGAGRRPEPRPLAWAHTAARPGCRFSLPRRRRLSVHAAAAHRSDRPRRSSPLAATTSEPGVCVREVVGTAGLWCNRVN